MSIFRGHFPSSLVNLVHSAVVLLKRPTFAGGLLHLAPQFYLFHFVFCWYRLYRQKGCKNKELKMINPNLIKC